MNSSKGEAFGLKVDKQELEQYRALASVDRLRELAQADKEGAVRGCRRARLEILCTKSGIPLKTIVQESMREKYLTVLYQYARGE